MAERRDNFRAARVELQGLLQRADCRAMLLPLFIGLSEEVVGQPEVGIHFQSLPVLRNRAVEISFEIVDQANRSYPRQRQRISFTSQRNLGSCLGEAPERQQQMRRVPVVSRTVLLVQRKGL